MVLGLLQPTAVTTAAPSHTVLETAAAFQGLILFAISGILAWTQWSLRKVMLPRSEHEAYAKETGTCYDGLDRRVSAVDRRVDGIARDVQDAVREIAATAEKMLTRQEYADLRVLLERANGSTNVLGAQLEAAKDVLGETRKLVGFINQHMIEEARR